MARHRRPAPRVSGPEPSAKIIWESRTKPLPPYTAPAQGPDRLSPRSRFADRAQSRNGPQLPALLRLPPGAGAWGVGSRSAEDGYRPRVRCLPPPPVRRARRASGACPPSPGTQGREGGRGPGPSGSRLPCRTRHWSPALPPPAPPSSRPSLRREPASERWAAGARGPAAAAAAFPHAPRQRRRRHCHRPRSPSVGFTARPLRRGPSPEVKPKRCLAPD